MQARGERIKEKNGKEREKARRHPRDGGSLGGSVNVARRAKNHRRCR